MIFYELHEMNDGRLYSTNFEGTIKNENPIIQNKVEQNWQWLFSQDAYVELPDGTRYTKEIRSLICSPEAANEKITESYIKIIKQHEITIANQKASITSTEFLIERIKRDLKGALL